MAEKNYLQTDHNPVAYDNKAESVLSLSQQNDANIEGGRYERERISTLVGIPEQSSIVERTIDTH